MGYRKTENTILPSNGKKPFSYCLYEPDDAPKAILHILPGLFGDLQYFEKAGLMESMAESRVIVCGCSSDDGQIPEKQQKNGAWKSALPSGEAALELFTVLRGKYRRLPYMMFGYGVGSSVLRGLLPEHGSKLDGAVLCGAYTDGGGFLSLALAQAASFLFGKGHACRFLQKVLCCRLNARCGAAQDSQLAWLCAEQGRFEDADMPYVLPDGKIRSADAGTLLAVYQLQRTFGAEDWAERIPRSLPVLLLSGKNDPAGDMESGIEALHEALFEAGIDDLQMKLYDGCRHELLFEACRQQLFTDLSDWISGVCHAKLQCETLPVFGETAAEQS